VYRHGYKHGDVHLLMSICTLQAFNKPRRER
jgi:hypothetical protein